MNMHNTVYHIHDVTGCVYPSAYMDAVFVGQSLKILSTS